MHNTSPASNGQDSRSKKSLVDVLEFIKKDQYQGRILLSEYDKYAEKHGIPIDLVRQAAELYCDAEIEDGKVYWRVKEKYRVRSMEEIRASIGPDGLCHFDDPEPALIEARDITPKGLPSPNHRKDLFRETAIKAFEAGLCVLPPKEDGSKAPDGRWLDYQKERSSLAKIKQWYGAHRRTGCGLVCGAVSGNLEVLEFDSGGRLYEYFRSIARAMGHGDLIDRLDRGYLERSPSGGYHWLYRCSVISGNTKLAKASDGTSLIETRGNGGYIIIAPSNGKVHPTGKPYELLAGGLDTIPRITPEERAVLFDLAKMMDETPDREDEWKVAVKNEYRDPGETSPWDEYNSTHAWEELLPAHGWTVVFKRDGVGYARRPGKDHSHSATFNHGGTDRLKCFSSSCEFETVPKTYSKFGAFAVWEHGGDWKAAIQSLKATSIPGKPSNGKPADSSDPNPLLRGYKPKTFAEIEMEIGQLEHLWPNMLVLGSPSMIWSKPKIGKTRLYIGIVKIMWFGTDWPDGTRNEHGPCLKTLVCPYDRNHAEIAQDMRKMEIPPEAAVCPHDPRDPTGVSLVPLDDPFMIDIIGVCLENDPLIKLIVVDTLTYASGKSLSKPEDMKMILDGIMGLALKHHVSVLLLCHENKEGSALGRRIDERARVLMRLERYSEQDPNRLRLFVKEGNFPVKPALTVVHTDKGVVFEPDAGGTGNAADRRDACAKWLVEYLWKKGERVPIDFGRLINAAGEAGFAGEQDEKTGYWSNRNLLNRAITAINEKVEALKEYHHLTIGREERPGRTRPVPWYWIEGNCP